jgi:predicted metalloprotease with PDZ domain
LRRFSLPLLLIFFTALAYPEVSDSTIHLAVDASDAPRNILHAKLTIPVHPGPVTLVYPKWIPGNHRPSGPIANVTGLRFEAFGKALTWQRDPMDMYAFHLQVPTGATEIVASFDTITSTDSAGATGSAASSQLLDLNWNQVVLYPEGTASEDVKVVPSVQLPSGWRFGTALTGGVQMESGGASIVVFAPTSLTTLVDSPLIAGAHYQQIELTREGDGPHHGIDLVGETDADIQMQPQDVTAYKNLVAEAGLLFGARHYRDYHFLYTLSDEVGHHGLEHHESSDNSAPGRTLSDPPRHLLEAALLPHEFVHSWNGKYRRPAGLVTRNYQEPMIGELLWVYEGLTEYLGNVLTARSGLWTQEEYREALALTAANLDHTPGRSWRPLEDTAVSVQILRLLGPEWENWRRGLDYYPEGELIWLEVDTRIRRLTGGKRSLDDFCRRFHGGQSGPPAVLPYSFDDIVKALNDIAPYDWRGLLNNRVSATSTGAPLEGIEQGGWRLVYTAQPNQFVQASEKIEDDVNLAYSLGFMVKKNGELQDVIHGSPAYQAGLGAGNETCGCQRTPLVAPCAARCNPQRSGQPPAHRDHCREQALLQDLPDLLLRRREISPPGTRGRSAGST